MSTIVKTVFVLGLLLIGWNVYKSTQPAERYVVVELQRLVAYCTPEEHAPTWIDWGMPGVPYKSVLLTAQEATDVRAAMEEADPGTWVDCPEAPIHHRSED